MIDGNKTLVRHRSVGMVSRIILLVNTENFDTLVLQRLSLPTTDELCRVSPLSLERETTRWHRLRARRPFRNTGGACFFCTPSSNK